MVVEGSNTTHNHTLLVAHYPADSLTTSKEQVFLRIEDTINIPVEWAYPIFIALVESLRQVEELLLQLLADNLFDNILTHLLVLYVSPYKINKVLQFLSFRWLFYSQRLVKVKIILEFCDKL